MILRELFNCPKLSTGVLDSRYRLRKFVVGARHGRCKLGVNGNCGSRTWLGNACTVSRIRRYHRARPKTRREFSKKSGNFTRFNLESPMYRPFRSRDEGRNFTFGRMNMSTAL